MDTPDQVTMNAAPTAWPPPDSQLLLEIEMPGEAQQAGSKMAFAIRRKDAASGRKRVVIKYDRNGDELAVISVTDQNEKKLKKRREELMGYLDHVMPEWTMPDEDQPLAVEVVFHRCRPLGHYGTGRNAEVLKATAPAFPAVLPDVTKLWRGEEDHLNGVIWPDDSRIVRQLVDERYINHWEKPYTLLRLWALPATVAEREQHELALFDAVA